MIRSGFCKPNTEHSKKSDSNSNNKASITRAEDLINVESRLRRYREERRVRHLKQSIKGWLLNNSISLMIGPYIGLSPMDDEESKKKKDHIVQFDANDVHDETHPAKNTERDEIPLCGEGKMHHHSGARAHFNSLYDPEESSDNDTERSKFIRHESIAEGFNQEKNDDEPSINTCAACRPRRLRSILAKLAVYCALQYLFFIYQFGAVFFCVACFYLIFTNLSERRRRRNTPSAYSVFNKNFHRLPGEVNAEQLQNGLMGALPMSMVMSV